MIVSTAVRVVAIACAGVLAGIYLGYGAGPQYALQALSASSFVQFQQIVHVHYLTFMPILVVAALLAAVVWLLMIRQRAQIRRRRGDAPCHQWACSCWRRSP